MSGGVKLEYLLWLGGIFTEDSMLKNTAISPAANRWQSGLISALARQDCHVTMISHLPEPLWPRGKVSPGESADLDSRFKNHFVPYLNMPFLRSTSLRWGYRQALHEVCRQHRKPLVVFSYNPSPHGISTGLIAQQQYNIPWIDVCADHIDPGTHWSQYAPRAELASGHVFLSYQAFVSCPFPKKIHLDGGINNLRFATDLPRYVQMVDKKIILYTGMMSIWGGLSYLLKAFEKVHYPGVELWVCGHGYNSDLTAAIRRDSRIRYYGCVSEARLAEISAQATVFVNPRPSHVSGNNMNFPSKILEYLCYGKPVISTWTPGLSPDYRSVLQVLGDESEDCLATTIENVLSWDSLQIQNNAKSIQTFLQDKTWEVQAQKLIKWLQGNIL